MRAGLANEPPHAERSRDAISVVIPAHNEERVIARLLQHLAPPWPHQQLEVCVVANGCTDQTAREAARVAPWATVIELDEASKNAALCAGDEASNALPRAYVDADVTLGYDDLVRLADALCEGVHAVAPRRTMVVQESSWAVRAYLRVWESLPAVREGLFGRGVIMVDAEGVDRISGRADLTGDDLVAHLAFTPDERLLVDDATSFVVAPRTARQLVRRRTRAAAGNRQVDRVRRGADPRSASSTTSGSVRGLVTVARKPSRWPELAAFLTITALARAGSRRGTTGWQRDESTR